jgi:hypothetical protein
MPTDPQSPLFGEKSRILLRDHVLLPEIVERAGDPFHPGDALVAYLATGEPAQVWQVPSLGPIGPRVEFATRFLTRYLVAAEQRSWPYLVLVLDLEMSRLYHGAADRLDEVQRHGFPAPPEIPSPEDAIPGPIQNAAPYEDHGEHVKQYLRTVDTRLGEALKEHDGLPVFLVGSEKQISIFEDLTGYGDLIAGTLPLTGMGNDPAPDLAKRLTPMLGDFRTNQVSEALAALDTARSQSRYVGGAPEVWTAVADQRVFRLVVEEGLVVAGQVGGDGRVLHVVPVPEPVTLPDPKEDVTPPQPGVATDIVEQLVENATVTDARVLFVPDGTLSEAGGIAAVLRY